MNPFASPTMHLCFTGKGGVGKTALSCTAAISLADRGKRVLLVSTDPASNLDEMRGVALGNQHTASDGPQGEERKQVSKEEPRVSALAMEQSERFKGTISEPTAAQLEEAQKNLEQAAQQRAELTGRTKEEALDELTEETSARRWEVEFAAIPEGPFYRPLRLGEQKRLIVNTDHPFYSKIYDAAPDVRAALEALLMVLAAREGRCSERA
jgi:hypothetical protein